ncbi:MAG: hypothetical protein M0013_06160 [Actinomycetota bacterium]|nr:hypothetical protein [Actinomycetota bacterium]
MARYRTPPVSSARLDASTEWHRQVNDADAALRAGDPQHCCTLTYLVHPDGLPPLGGPLVAIRALVRTA